MLAPAEVERKLLSSLLEPKDLTRTVAAGVLPESFVVHRATFEFMMAYAQAYEGNLPKQEDVEQHFRDSPDEIEFTEGGQLQFYIDELLKLQLARQVRDSLRLRLGDEGEELVSDPGAALSLILLDLQKLQRARGNNMAFFDRDALQRLEWVEERMAAAAAGKVIGIPTGLAVFDKYHQGWAPGEAVMLMGPKGCGKSWMLLYFACVAYRHGSRILFMSPEMSWEQCALRFDVLLASLYEKSLSHTKLSTGLGVDLEAYREWLSELTRREDFICVDSPPEVGFTLGNVTEMVEEFNPDVIILDGIHLTRNSAGTQDWASIKEVADGLKALVQRRKGVAIWSGQVDREGMRNPSDPVSSGAQAAYCKAAVEPANRLITMGTDLDNPHRRTFKVPNNRDGREWPTRQVLAFEVDIGFIEQVEELDMAGFEDAPEI
jgi:KaiC/GvpD/RAD55 family RecA-like ATPase